MAAQTISAGPLPGPAPADQNTYLEHGARRTFAQRVRTVEEFVARLRLRLAERALRRPFTTAASLRLDRALVALERLQGAP